ncbi:MAG: TraR/DksA C4-type zinc finger protein [Patescibacteria group bacterium]
MINSEKAQQFKGLLEEEKKRLEENSKSLQDVDFGDAPGEDNEEADESEEASNELASIQLLERRLIDIGDALERIGAGTYGICTRCGEEISEELLEAMPESSFCKKCKAS